MRSQFTTLRLTDEMIDGAMTVGLIGIALLGFRAAYGGFEFLFVGVVATLIGVLVMALIRRRNVALMPAIAVTLGIFVLAAGPLALRAQTFLILVPTPASFVALVDGVTRGWARLLTTAIPTGGIDDLLVIPYAVGFLGGLVTYLLARATQRQLLVILPAFAVLVLTVVFGTTTPVSLLIQGAVFLTAGMLWMSMRRERHHGERLAGSPGRPRWVGVTAMLLLVVGGAMLLGSIMPLAQANPRMVLRDRIEPPFDPREYSSPLSTFRKFHVDLADQVLFRIVDGSSQESNIRIAVLDEYDGVVWNAAARNIRGAGYFERVGDVVAMVEGQEMSTVTIEIVGLDGVWLPTLGVVSSLEFAGPRGSALADSFRWNRWSSTGVMPMSLTSGDTYVILYAATASHDSIALRSLAVDKSIVFDEVVGLPSEFAAMAADIVAGAANPYDQANRLEQHFQAGAYRIGGPDDTRKVPPGHSIGRIARFLGSQQLVGDAEQYAAAMALMARSLNMPARVVVGFKMPPGSDPIVIRGEDINAWVEIAFDGAGWVPFFPTPDEANAPQEDVEEQAQRIEAEIQVPPPISNPPFVDDPVLEEVEDSQEEDAAAPLPEAGSGIPGWLIWSGASVSIPVFAMGAFAGVVWLVKDRRTKRRRTQGTTAERISAGWTDVLDLARDQGRSLVANATRSETAHTLGGTATALASLADSAVFGRSDPLDSEAVEFWDATDTMKTSMADGYSPWGTLRATASLKSLKPLR